MHDSDDAPTWNQLRLQQATTWPVIYYSYRHRDGAFQIDVTDLVSLWQCHLDRDALISQARTQRSSIDPSESHSQAEALCSRLAQSLKNGRNVISRPRRLSTGEVIGLETAIKLPTPLKPLSWSFILRQAQANKFANRITRPALNEVARAEHKLDSLLQVVKDKDHVITRLLDKIEASNIDLSLIFPGITGLTARKSHVSVAEAKKHVPGLSTFDRAAWFSQLDQASTGRVPSVASLSACNQKYGNRGDRLGLTSDWVKEMRSTTSLDVSQRSGSTSSEETRAQVRRGRRGGALNDASTSTDPDVEVRGPG